MPRFEFRWKSLLAVRQSELDQKRAELGAALAEERKLTLERTALEHQLSSQRQHRRLEPGQLDLSRVQADCRFESTIRSQLAAIESRQLALKSEIELRRKAALEADRQLRTLDKLRTRQLEQFASQSERAERKQLDEAAARSTPFAAEW
ncbi:MAG TPA: hypothetical protein VHW01_06165 [Polyangiaceae bacterium]|jgi:flagellar biosynthesis chaperone FliJ|nr:hypothetical protein [Polyangiaceae bacterium]